MRRRAAFLSLGVACAAVGVWSACKDYDDATEIPPPDAATTDVTTTSSSSSSSSGGADSSVTDADAPDQDAASHPDADAATCADPCDCDGDQYPKKSCYDASSDAGFDCDDNDERRHPGQGFLDDKTDDGDWNCNTIVEKQIGIFGACSSLSSCSNPVPMFLTDVPCGEKADTYICKSSLAICTKTLADPMKQSCR